MTYKNSYKINSKIDNKILLKILKYFCMDFSATDTSKLLKIRRPTVNNVYNYFRQVIFEHETSIESKVMNGIIELDESYFGQKRVRGKRRRGAGGKIKVFGLLKRQGRVYTHIVDDVTAQTLLPIIRGKIELGSSINTDGRHSYDGLVDLGYKKHYRVNHGNDEFVRGNQHINGIESFRGYCKRKLVKFNGVNKDKFALHLKECEFRFNCGLGKEDMYAKCKKILKQYVKNF